MKIYGPYLTKEGRLIVILYENGKTTSRSYPRYVLEEKLGRKLNDSEDVHHKDGNPLNNEPDNLDAKWYSDHILHHNYNPDADLRTIIKFKCPECGNGLEITVRQYRTNQILKGRAGPFCSRKCAGTRNQRRS